MKWKITLSVILVSSTVVLLQSTSFSTANIKNDTSILIVPEEDALISIGYDPELNKTVQVTNNLDAPIWLDFAYLVGVEEAFIDAGQGEIIPPDGIIHLPLIGSAADMINKQIKLHFNWGEGQAEIDSILPTFFYDEIVMQGVNMDMTLEVENSKANEIENKQPKNNETATDVVESITNGDETTTSTETTATNNESPVTGGVKSEGSEN